MFMWCDMNAEITVLEFYVWVTKSSDGQNEAP